MIAEGGAPLRAGGTVVDGEATACVAAEMDRTQAIVAIAADAALKWWSWPVPPGDAKYGGWLRGLAIGRDRTLYVAIQSALFALRG